MKPKDDRGAISTFLAVLGLALLMAAGLAVDGGQKIASLRDASHLADNAARAGAQAVDVDHLRTTGEVHLNEPEALALADNYLTAAGHDGTITVDTAAATVTVTVTLTHRPVLLPTGDITVTATETATAITEEPGT